MHTHKRYGLNEYSSKYGVENVTKRRDRSCLIQSIKNEHGAVNSKDNSTADQNKPDKYVDLNRRVKVNPIYSGFLLIPKTFRSPKIS